MASRCSSFKRHFCNLSIKHFSRHQQLQSAAVGLSAGFVGSLVGMGGAFVALPFLTGSIGLSQHLAHGTSMAAVLLTSTGGIFMYSNGLDSRQRDVVDQSEELWLGFMPARFGDIHTPTAVSVATAATIMAMAGARISKALPSKYLKFSLSVFMLLVAPLAPARDLILQTRDCDSEKARINPSIVHIPRLLAIGSISGFLAGLFGVGGGAVVVPALLLTTNLDYKAALGTSLAAMFPSALSGGLTHFRQGTMLLPCAVPLAAGSLAGSIIGAKVAKHTDDMALKYCFSALMFTLGVRTFRQAIKVI